MVRQKEIISPRGTSIDQIIQKKEEYSFKVDCRLYYMDFIIFFIIVLRLSNYG